jgi:hypothetical protein
MEMHMLFPRLSEACDAISGSEDRAPRDHATVLQRIKELETLAMDTQRVEKAYAIQAAGN